MIFFENFKNETAEIYKLYMRTLSYYISVYFYMFRFHVSQYQSQYQVSIPSRTLYPKNDDIEDI